MAGEMQCVLYSSFLYGLKESNKEPYISDDTTRHFPVLTSHGYETQQAYKILAF